MIRNIIFDWSGTLVDDLPAVWKATNYVLARAQCAEMTLEEFRAAFCLPFTIFYDRHVPHVPLKQLEAWYHDRYLQIQDSVGALPHAREFLKFCRARKLRTLLLSSVHSDHFAVQSAATGFGRYLDKTYVEVRDKRKKIHEILKQNDLRPGETLFVGDMQHDIETARHGGIHSCAVLTGYNTLEQLRTADPDLIVEHLGELRQILQQNGLNMDRAGARRSPGFAVMPPRGPVATVGALIFNKSGEVLMVRTRKWSDLWGIPGGKIKWGEPAVEALRREIREETGLDITDIKLVLAQDCIRSKEFYREAHFILLNYTCRSVGNARVKLNDEAQAFRWVTPAQAMRLPLNEPTRKLVRAAMREAVGAEKKGKRKHVENQRG